MRIVACSIEIWWLLPQLLGELDPDFKGLQYSKRPFLDFHYALALLERANSYSCTFQHSSPTPTAVNQPERQLSFEW